MQKKKRVDTMEVNEPKLFSIEREEEGEWR